MAGLWTSTCPRPPHLHRLRCSSTPPTGKTKTPPPPPPQTPPLLKIAVSGATELLRLFSSAAAGGDKKTVPVDAISASDVNDVVSIIRTDYERAYFVTGDFTSAIYAEDCTFEDPTIKFRGTELYARNLSLLVPFFDEPSIQLKEIGCEGELCIIASWKLRTYLKLPWRPLICIDGRTVYDLDEGFRIIRHVERWNVSAFEAVVQIFTPSYGRSDQ
ncbi:hypothetical protein BUALT_Bualt05G0041700 [Buddleja alternifolia]|uniref:NTF2-like domain containing protein n=1 Tax=Buddleja alternifolia TaxID=168488 RepID=A0AAV6XHY8_9LAMI|nr:hypothetical protein BUALT_Bualt05G0041700 [Buddleja alternifolia]